MGFKANSSNPGDVTPPTVPPNVAASVTNVGLAEVTVTWGVSADTSGIKEYRVLRQGSGVEVVVPAASPRLLKVSGLTVGVDHVFEVRAVDNHLNVSLPGFSNAVKITAAFGWTFTQSAGQKHVLTTTPVAKGDTVSIPGSLWSEPAGTNGVFSLVNQTDGTTINPATGAIKVGPSVADNPHYTVNVQLVNGALQEKEALTWPSHLRR